MGYNETPSHLPKRRSRRRIAGDGREETGKKQPCGKKMSVWKMIVIDIFAAGVVLCVFSYFHHVNPIGEKSNPIVLPQKTAQVPAPAPDAAQTKEPSKFAEKFLAVGEEPQKTENSYVSQNVHVTVETKQEGDVTYHVADIYVRDVTYLKTAMAGGDYDGSWQNRGYVNEIGKSVNAFVAINGDQCTGHKEGVVVRNGVLYREVPYKDVCVLRYDGTLETISQSEFDMEALKEEGAWQAWSFGPMLLDNGQPMENFNSEVQEANPRSAIGMVEPGHYLLVSVDGRGESVGMTLKELSQLFYDLGCATAYNLDGGDTSAMAVDGKIYSAPSGDRKATDIIYIGME